MLWAVSRARLRARDTSENASCSEVFGPESSRCLTRSPSSTISVPAGMGDLSRTLPQSLGPGIPEARPVALQEHRHKLASGQRVVSTLIAVTSRRPSTERSRGPGVGRAQNVDFARLPHAQVFRYARDDPAQAHGSVNLTTPRKLTASSPALNGLHHHEYILGDAA